MPTNTTSALIRAAVPGVTFVQLWRTPSAEAQRAWLETMHARVGLLTAKPGFVTMTLLPAADGRRVCVYAQWRGRADLDAAIADPAARAAHAELAHRGDPEGTVYAVDGVFTPAGTTPAATVAADAPVATFLNFWRTPSPDNQHHLLDAMRAEVGPMTRQPGFVSLCTHASADGARVFVYAQWRREADFHAAVAGNPAALASRQALARWGEPEPGLFRVGAVFGPTPPAAAP